MRYRIEIMAYGEVVASMETDNYRDARQYYLAHIWDLDCWTQLYVDGKSVCRRKADRIMRADAKQYQNFISRVEIAERRWR